MAVIPLIIGSHVRTAKKAFLAMCMQYNIVNYNLLINNWQLTNISGHLVFTNVTRTQYNSSQDAYLKFQNGGTSTCQLRQGFSMKTPTYV